MQSQSLQQFAHWLPQQIWPSGQSVPVELQRLFTQVAPEQPALGHSESVVHWMQPSGGWHLKPTPSAEQFWLLGVNLQPPFWQVSSVQPTPSVQSVSWQQVRQPIPGQHRVPAPQPTNSHFPALQWPVWQGVDGHWLSTVHSTV